METASSSSITTGPNWVLRVARPEDNAELCTLFKSQHLKSSLDLAQERDPDFFRLPELHHGTSYETLIARHVDSGEVLGCGTVVVREGFLDGERVRTGYLCDLRVAPALRGGRHLAQGYGDYFDQVRARHGVEVFTTVIFDDNKQARAALTRRTEARKRQPVYKPMTSFQMTSIQFTRQKPAPLRAIRRASSADMPALLEFLGRREHGRVLGHVLDESLFQKRLSSWPGFALESFYLAHDSRGRLVGCLAPWDTASFKRTRVLSYHGSMWAVRHLFNAAASLLRVPGLPEPGACFRFPFLTHLEIEDEDPAILRDLLRAVYRDHRGGDHHFMSAMIPRRSRLEPAFAEFFVQRTPMTLYSVHPPGSRYEHRDLRTLRPGFEMALS